MAATILGQLHTKITDAIDGARSAGAALARSAHEIVDCAHAETVSTAVGTSGRADLIDRETVRVLLTGANLARVDGMLSAYGIVLRLLDDARADTVADARGRVEAEAQKDARTYLGAVANDGETEKPEAWAVYAFAAWVDDDDRAIGAPLTRDEARAVYVAAFKQAVEVVS